MKFPKHTEMLRDLYDEHPPPSVSDNILLQLLYHLIHVDFSEISSLVSP